MTEYSVSVRKGSTLWSVPPLHIKYPALAQSESDFYGSNLKFSNFSRKLCLASTDPVQDFPVSTVNCAWLLRIQSKIFLFQP